MYLKTQDFKIISFNKKNDVLIIYLFLLSMLLMFKKQMINITHIIE